MTTQDFLPIVAEQREEFLSEDFTEIITLAEEKQIDLNSKLAQVVIGVRRSGKSTLCRKMLREAKVTAAYIKRLLHSIVYHDITQCFGVRYPETPERLTTYTDSIDACFDYSSGHLEYRTVRFETEVLDMDDIITRALDVMV